MSTQPNRGATWSNPDGLVVGFGTHKVMKQGSAAKNYAGAGGVKTASVTFNYKDAAGTGGTVNVPVPADSTVLGVTLVVGTAWAGGTKLEVGLTGGDVDGFLTAAQGATAELTAGRRIVGAGALLVDDPAAASTDGYEIGTSADTVDVLLTGTFTAGDATLVVTYL